MKRRDLEFETLVREALKGKKVPILVLDRRWHTLFPQGEKPAEIIQLEKNQQRLLLEIKERIETESDELIELPRMIKKANEELLATGAHYCFERLANGDEQLKIVKQEIEELRISLREKTEWKDDLEESMDSAYSLMHGLLGHDVMNLYDKRKGKE